MLNKIKQIKHYFSQSMRLMVGIPEYDIYLTHMKNAHPDQPVMSYEEFFQERQKARYGGKGKISCC